MAKTLEMKWQDWQPCGSDGHQNERLLGTMRILGVPHHVEAIKVRVDTLTQVQVACDPVYGQEQLDSLTSFSEPDGPFLTVELPGREGDWVLGIAPYAD